MKTTTTTHTTDERASLESLRSYLADSDYADRWYWLGAIDCALGLAAVGDNAPASLLLKPRKYRHCAGHGAQKTLVAATPIGGVLPARNYAHAQTLRNTAKLLGRRVQVRQATPGSIARNVTLLD